MPVHQLCFSEICTTLERLILAFKGSDYLFHDDVRIVNITNISDFASHYGLSRSAPVVKVFPLSVADTLVCHPVIDCIERKPTMPLPLHEYLYSLSVANGSRPFKRILLPLLEAEVCGVTVAGYQVPLLYTMSTFLNVQRTHWTLLEMTFENGIFNITVHDSKSGVINNVVGFYPVASYLASHFTQEVCTKLGALFGVSGNWLSQPNISVKFYGTQAVTNYTECGYHTIAMTMALLQNRSYTEVLQDSGGSIVSFVRDIDEEDYYKDVKSKVSNSKFRTYP